MKILFFKSPVMVWDGTIRELQAEFPETKFIPQDKITDADIADAEAFVGVAPHGIIEKAENLRIIFINFTGSDLLPMDLIRERGIRLSNTHGNARFVAERAIAMTLAFYGKIMSFHNDLKEGKWHGIFGGGGTSDSWESLYEKKCAVIGTGEIGKWTAHYLSMFGCGITGVKNSPAPEGIDNFDRVATDLRKAVKDNEIIFITLPLTVKTRRIFSREILSAMNDKFLVNIGRGEVIDEKGLFDSLKNGILKGAALDVWFDYPAMDSSRKYPSKYPFHELENVIFSPHVGGSAAKASVINLEQTVENIRAYIKTGIPVFEVNIKREY